MPRPNSQAQAFDALVRFDGGMNQMEPTDTQFLYGKNIAIRDGHATTRPGIRRAFRNSGVKEAFWFNEENAKYNDGTHLGFWFDFDFVESIWDNIQGCEVVRLPDDERQVLLLVREGVVYQNDTGIVTQIPTAVTIGADEEINFTQAFDQIIMWRGEDLVPLIWDGSTTGFTLVPDPDTQSAIPNSVDGVYVMARIWAYRDRSEVNASDLLDFNDWDRVYSTFSIEPGDGDEIVSLWPFHDDKILVFKKTKIFGLAGITDATLSNSISSTIVDTQRGAVGPDAIVTFGEHIAFVGYGHVYDMIRNEQNRMQGIDLPLSWQIPFLMARINWDNTDATEGIAATSHNNYLLFAVPLDSSPTNNAILAYDLLGNGGQGSWCGLWQSGQTRVKKWLKMNGKLYFMGYDSIVREMFVDIPADSDPQDVFADTRLYASGTQYYLGETVKLAAGDTIYQATRDTLGNAPTDTDYWEALADPIHAYDLETEVLSSYVEFRDPSSKNLGKTELLFRHQDPKISVSIKSRDYQTEETLFSDVEFSQVEYDTIHTDDWDDTNTDLDFRSPHRKDYTIYIPSGETIYMDVTGIDLGVWEEHELRFLKRLINDRAFAIRFISTRGKISLRSIVTAGKLKKFAQKSR